MDRFGTYLTHAQTCDDVRVRSATGMVCFWFASVHITHMSNPVMTFGFIVLQNGQLKKGIFNRLDCQFHRFTTGKRQFCSWSHGPAT